jgi:hypothetical protein
MERSDFTRDDHRRALQDYLETIHPDGSETADSMEAVTHVQATFSEAGVPYPEHGVLLGIYPTSGEEPTFTKMLSPHDARVIAFQILGTADWAEWVDPKTDSSSLPK